MSSRLDRDIVQDAEFRVEKKGIPGLIYDGHGNVRWTLPTNTPEENEQIGIRNIQLMFLHVYSEFDELFPRGENNKVTDAQRRDAAEFIRDRVGHRKYFDKIFTATSYVNPITIPYFNGSFPEVLRRSFASWGIKFKIRDFPGENIWKGKNKEEVLELVRTIFLEDNEGFGEKYLAADGTVLPEELEEVARFVQRFFSKKSVSSIIQGVIRKAAWAERSIVKLEQDAFAPWGLTIEPLRLDRSIEDIEREAKAILESEGDISTRILRRRKKHGLIIDISRKYPDKTSGLRAKFGLEPFRKDYGYWTIDQIEAEAFDFYQKYGGVSHSLLQEHNRSDLYSQILKKYPDGMVAIERKARDAYDTQKGVAISPDQAWEDLQVFFEDRELKL